MPQFAQPYLSLLTGRARLLQAGSLASNICQARPAGQPLTLKLELGHREPLAGPELEAFYASRAAHAVEEDEPQAMLTPRQASPLHAFSCNEGVVSTQICA